MKGTLDFDPAQYEYGPATTAVRQILLEWYAIDWFVPPRDDAAGFSSMRLFGQHTACALAYQPELFPVSVEIQLARGGFREFAAFCERVRSGAAGSWDWKFGALKKLSNAHSRAHGWTLGAQGKGCVSLESGARPRPGDLFVRFGEHVMWALSPTLDLNATLLRDHAEPAGWYLSYANMDIIDCIEWQLSESSNRLEGNPFVPLLRCYSAGFYPFSLGPDRTILFAFTE